MNETDMINDLVKMLDAGMASGTGHVNVDVNGPGTVREVETMGCADCNSNPMACSIPTLHEGLDDNN